jgi:HEAT repeat protein
MNRRRKRITVLAAMCTVLVCAAAAILARDIVREWWLLKVLHHADQSERFRAARALGELGSLKAVPILLGLEAEEFSHGIYENALTSICERRRREVIPALIQGLRCEGTLRSAAALAARSIRMFCSDRLAVFGPEAREAIPALMEALVDEDPWVRVAAVQALGSMGPTATESSKSLIRVLQDEDDSVVFNAALALLQIAPDCKEGVLAMVKFLSDEDHGSRALAEGKLRELGLLPGIDELISFLGHEDPQLRRSVALVLASQPSDMEKVFPALVRLLGDENHFVVEAALSGLERFAERDAATVGKVTDLLHRVDVRVAAIRFLARSTAASSEALATVLEGLREGSTTAEFLDGLADAPPETLSSALIPRLVDLCRAGLDPERRLTAVEVLWNMGPAARSAVPALEAILEKEEDLEFESWALNAIESIGR